MAQYDPNKKYTWGPEDKFEISGQDFGLILNTVRSFLASEEAARFQLMLKSNEVIEQLMAEHVEKGTVKEVKEEE